LISIRLRGVPFWPWFLRGGVAAFTHWRLGNVETGLLKGLIAGIILGTYAGGSCANLLPEFTLRIIFVAFLIWTGIRYLKVPAPSYE